MKTLTKITKYFLMILISFIAIIPFYVLLKLSLDSSQAVYATELRLLPDFQFINFVEAWKISNLGRALFNSITITTIAIIILITFASSAGYAIARFESRFNRVIFNVMLLCMMIPGIINTVPLYTLMIDIGGINTHWAMALVCATNALPFSVFIYTGFVKTVPKEVEESAIIEGCTWFSAFWRITFHFLKPVTSAVIIIMGLSIWNNYAQAVFFLQSQRMRTIPLAISMFFQQYGAKWNLMAAASVMGILPVIVIFLVFQKFFIKGIAAGAVKG